MADPVSTVACTDDVFTCPDGTYLSRDDKCEFNYDDCCIQDCSNSHKIYGTYSETAQSCSYSETCSSLIYLILC